MGLRNRASYSESGSPQESESLIDTPYPDNRQELVCPVSDNRQGLTYAGATFLLNVDSSRREHLAIHLRSIGYKVYIPEEHGKATHGVTNGELRAAGLVIFEVSSTSFCLLSELRRIWNIRKGGKPFVIVWLTTRCDAEFELKVEELADRVVAHVSE